MPLAGIVTKRGLCLLLQHASCVPDLLWVLVSQASGETDLETDTLKTHGVIVRVPSGERGTLPGKQRRIKDYKDVWVWKLGL